MFNQGSSDVQIIQKIDGNGDWYYNISPNQVSNLVGQVLTQLEAMGLPESQLKANKAIFNRMVYGWFEEVKDNCRTSSLEVTKPFELIRTKDGFAVRNSNGKQISYEAWDAKLSKEERELASQ